MSQLLNPRIIYEFPKYIDINLKIPDPIELSLGIQNVLIEEFFISCDLENYDEIFNLKVSSEKKFTSCVCLLTGDLYFYCLDVKKYCGGFDLIPKVKYFEHALVFKWKNVQEIDYAKFYF